jgi:tRNA pseudouridine55 synthase
MGRNFIKGEVLLINKPLGWTSFQVVNKIRWILRSKLNIDPKVGHAGTLDPLATGLLILCTGKLTKSIEEYQAQEKEYEGTFTLGATTPSYDMEKTVDKTYPIQHITSQLIMDTAKGFEGTNMQVPPQFSAIKIKGVRAYDNARKGEETEIKPREITISSFEVTNISMPIVSFRITCSKGTYIRSIARDLGERLKSGAYLSSLIRTRIGEFKLSNAFEIADFEKEVVEQNSIPKA